MKTLYKISDWTSASKMRNTISSNLRLDVGVFPPEDVLDSPGYQITVYDNLTGRVDYKFYVDRYREGIWSLDTDAAVEILNIIGFPCEYDKESRQTPPYIIPILRSLRDLGIVSLYKIPISREVSGIDKDGYSKDILDMTRLSYGDFWFIDDVIEISIDSLLSDIDGEVED